MYLRYRVGFVVGAKNEDAFMLMRQLYEPFSLAQRNSSMPIRGAELAKYAANAIVATRISFKNELTGVAEAVGTDFDAVPLEMGSDSRIGEQFLPAGAGYGGFDLPGKCKSADLNSLLSQASASNSASNEEVNEGKKSLLSRS